MSKREVVRQNALLHKELLAATASVEMYATACRLAATQIRAIVETLPENRYKSQQEMLLLAAEGLDAQAIDVTVGACMEDPEIIQSSGLLGQGRVGYAFAAIAALSAVTSAGFDIADHLTAQAAVREVEVYNSDMLVSIGQVIIGAGSPPDEGDTAEGVGTSMPPTMEPDDIVVEEARVTSGGPQDSGATDDSSPASPGGGTESSRKDSIIKPGTVEARADVPRPVVRAGTPSPDVVTGRAEVPGSPIGSTNETDEAPPITVVQPTGSVIQVKPGTAEITATPSDEPLSDEERERIAHEYIEEHGDELAEIDADDRAEQAHLDQQE